jgi:hypothetical protein
MLEPFVYSVCFGEVACDWLCNNILKSQLAKGQIEYIYIYIYIYIRNSTSLLVLFVII